MNPDCHVGTQRGGGLQCTSCVKGKQLTMERKWITFYHLESLLQGQFHIPLLQGQFQYISNLTTTENHPGVEAA